MDIGPIEGGGRIAFAGRTHFDGNKIDILDARFQIEKFGFEGYGISVLEPRLDGTTNMAFDIAKSEFSLNSLNADGESVRVSSPEFRVVSSDQIRMSGRFNFEGEVQEITKWIGLTTKPDDLHYFGRAQGSFVFDPSSNNIGGQAMLDITDLLVAQRVAQQSTNSSPMKLASAQTTWSELWKEPTLKIESDLEIGSDYDSLQFQKLGVRAKSGSLTTRGRIAQLTGAMMTDLSGTWTPNYAVVNQVVAESIGNVARLKLPQTESFELNGPLFALNPDSQDAAAWVPAALRLNTSVSWTESEVYKIPFGSNRLLVNVEQSVAKFQLEPIPFEGGMLFLAPQLDMSQSVGWLTLPSRHACRSGKIDS